MAELPTALLRAPCPSLATRCALTYLEREPIDVDRVRRQHAAYARALEEGGHRTAVLPLLPGCPDAVFVEDAAVVLPEVAILTRPALAARADEPALIAPTLGRLRDVVALGRGSLEGGDVLRLGRTVFVGRSTRTDADGCAALAELIEPLGYRVRPVPVRGALHLRTAVGALDDGTVLVHPGWVDPDDLPGVDAVPVDPAEPFAANVVALPDGSVLADAGYPRTAGRLEEAGYRVRPVPLGEFAKAEAGPTCLSLRCEGGAPPCDGDARRIEAE